MAGFIYHTPGGAHPSLEYLQSIGMGYAFDAEPAVRDTLRGPKGSRPGKLFGCEARWRGRFALEEENQEWQKIPGRDGKAEVWMGWSKVHPPKPEDLLKPVVMDGFILRAADGREWQIPAVRKFDVETRAPLSLLPCYMKLDDKGRQVRGEPKEAYAWLWDLTEPAWQAMFNDSEISQDEMMPVAAGIFRANYFVDAPELYAMHVYDDRGVTPFGVAALAIDWLTFRSWSESQKKTNSEPTGDGSPTNDGAADSLPLTHQPAPTF